MITTLHIKNIGIIEDITINLNSGFNVLTGETGAGKSLIIDSLMILCGGRFSKDMIRRGQEYSFVEACIYVPKNEYAEDGNIIVSREIHINGRNLCKINGRMVTVNILKSIMTNIIDIHAQNDSHDIMFQASHINYLDNYANNEVISLKEEYSKLYSEYKKINEELENNFGNEKQKQRTLDLLTYQLNEINNARLKMDEENKLEEKLKIIQNKEKVYNNLTKSSNILSDNIISNFENVISCLSKIESFDAKYMQSLTSIQSLYYDVQDIYETLNGYLYENEYCDLDSNEITSRLDLIYSLKRKYGNNIDEILKYKSDIQEQIDKIMNLEEYNKSLKIKLDEIKLKMNEICNNLHEKRAIYAKKLSEKINNELKDLEMESASFKVEVNLENQYTKNGLDKVEFVISTNIGEEYKPLVKIASGGEMSRIMLAIKVVLANISETSVIIFDEIDTGISGTAARAFSEKMKILSKTHQLICISHLPVIAAKADYNYKIQKEVVEDNTITSIKLLNESETLNEIARISSGNVTDISLKHAMELRKSCESYNKISA